METQNKIVSIDRSKIEPIVNSALMNGRIISTENMDKELWLGIRLVLGLGGSDVAVALGISKYKTAYQLWKEKVADEVEIIENKFTIWGNLLEDPIAQEYMRITGRIAVKDNKIRIHPKHDCLFVNLDRVILDNGVAIGLLECKSTVRRVYENWQKNEDDCPQGIPLDYYCQVQHELSVSGLPWADLAFAILDDRETIIKRIERDEDYIEQQNNALVLWWNAYVLNNEAPPMTAGEYSFITPMEESFVEATGEIADLYIKLKEQKEVSKGLEKEISELEDKLKAFIGERENLVLIDKVIATWKTQSRTSVDSKKLKADKPDIFRDYSKTSTFRVFKLKDIN